LPTGRTFPYVRIIGLGSIGREVARTAETLGMKIAYHDPSPIGNPPRTYQSGSE